MVRIEAKRKLSQNKSDADRAGAIAGLAGSPLPRSDAVRRAMNQAVTTGPGSCPAPVADGVGGVDGLAERTQPESARHLEVAPGVQPGAVAGELVRAQIVVQRRQAIPRDFRAGVMGVVQVVVEEDHPQRQTGPHDGRPSGAA